MLGILAHAVDQFLLPECASSWGARMRGLLAAATLIIATSAVASAQAQSYPSRPITMIVPAAAGGPTDTIARIITEGMRTSLGQAIIIENIGTAAGSIVVGGVAHAAPDGSRLSIGNWATHVVNGAIYTDRFDLLKDFEPIALLSSNPAIIVARNATPADDLGSLIGWLK